MGKLRSEQSEAAEAIQRQHGGDKALPKQRVMERSFVRVARGVSCRCNPGETSALFTRGSDTLRLPIAATASRLISALCDGKAHIVVSLPCDDHVERVCVCQILIFKGCLELAEAEDLAPIS